MLIIVKLNLEDGSAFLLEADVSEALEKVDYEFKHKDIISTEIVDVIIEE